VENVWRAQIDVTDVRELRRKVVAFVCLFVGYQRGRMRGRCWADVESSWRNSISFSRRASPFSWTSDHGGGVSPAGYFSLRVLDKGVAKRRGSRGIRGLGPVLPRYQDTDCKVRGVGVAALPSTNVNLFPRLEAASR
jgi:hypothetical protein